MEINEWHEVGLSVSFNYYKSFAPRSSAWRLACETIMSSLQAWVIDLGKCAFTRVGYGGDGYDGLLCPGSGCSGSRCWEGPIIELTSHCTVKVVVQHGSQHWRFRKQDLCFLRRSVKQERSIWGQWKFAGQTSPLKVSWDHVYATSPRSLDFGL